MKQPDKKLLEKWEKRLKKAGLGVVQPLTDHSDDGESLLNMAGSTDEMSALRKKVDGSDRFMEAHQIMKVATKDRVVPEWALNDKAVQRILLLAFPKLKTCPRQHARAGIYVRIIHLYWRMKLPLPVVAKEMKLTEMLTKRKILAITRLAGGLTTFGGVRKRVTHLTPLEGNTEGRHETVQSTLLHNSGDGSNGEDGAAQENVPLPQGSGLPDGE